jgi:hypothetical protein
VISLALDEPATDFSEEDLASLEADLQRIAALPEAERTPAFLRIQLAAGVDLPAPPPGPPPPWMTLRPAGIDAFAKALPRYRIGDDVLRTYRGPVYYSHGSLSHPRWQTMRDRLALRFTDFRSDFYQGLHHLNTSHQQEPARVAAALRQLWGIA